MVNVNVISSVFDSSTNKIVSVTLGDGTVCVAGGVVPKTVAAVTTDTTPGEVAANTEVTLSCGTEGATIFYTKDGSAPSMSKTRYTGKIKITADTTIKAVACKDGWTSGEVQTFAYTVA